MDRAVRQWHADLQCRPSNIALNAIIRKLSKSYTIYGSMILMPPGSIDDIDLKSVFCKEQDSEVRLYEQVAKHLKVTHIAINQPIPTHHEQGLHRSENVMRAPVNFQPLYGDFGPTECSSPLTAVDIKSAYWVTAKQNGIAQTWAPRWTMFSRGNITEKARVLNLPSVATAVSEGHGAGTGCSAIDLYAGIGYFAFSYVKAGMSKVLCWELNGWSCEGLRQGAKANRWQVTSMSESLQEAAASGPEQIVLFNESNELALKRLHRLRSGIPPVRHVNCGLLPTSQPSWRIAFDCLDPILGGWIHVHENFANAEIEARADDVRNAFQDFMDQQPTTGRVAVLESINRVKTYAPGVWHCVLDILIPARRV